ncbi:MAG: hypothetical protein J3K34DRAFT_23257 [Monoraphidium minutum]|nr:MAG: hypothetical protein J3K34DRAFT_23257 [Monoraphidium minutum]
MFEMNDSGSDNIQRSSCAVTDVLPDHSAAWVRLCKWDCRCVGNEPHLAPQAVSGERRFARWRGGPPWTAVLGTRAIAWRAPSPRRTAPHRAPPPATARLAPRPSGPSRASQEHGIAWPPPHCSRSGASGVRRCASASGAPLRRNPRALAAK